MSELFNAILNSLLVTVPVVVVIWVWAKTRHDEPSDNDDY